MQWNVPEKQAARISPSVRFVRCWLRMCWNISGMKPLLILFTSRHGEQGSTLKENAIAAVPIEVGGKPQIVQMKRGVKAPLF